MYQFFFDACSIVGGILFTAFLTLWSMKKHRKSSWPYLWFALPCIIAAIMISFLKNSESPKATPFITLDDPVYEARILLVFQRPVRLDSLRDFDIRFELRSAAGILYLRARVLDAVDIQRNRPLRIIGGIDAAARTPTLYACLDLIANNTTTSQHLQRLPNLWSDTLDLRVELNGIGNLPFKTLHDFQGMYFTPHLPKGIIPLIKECWLIANAQIVVKCRFKDAFWAPAVVRWADDTTFVDLFWPCASDPRLAQKPPNELWQIDLRKPQ